MPRVWLVEHQHPNRAERRRGSRGLPKAFRHVRLPARNRPYRKGGSDGGQ